ncbi:MAG: hypothetical protein JJU11_04410 [Candidatus Sumerlaeia bacterium]|nr:hypothetical protein [Candidatus Sumerlaeia bacterium]
MKQKTPIAMVTVLLLALSPWLYGDLIILTNGREIEGRILIEEDHRIQIESRGIQTWLSKDRIDRIEVTPEYSITISEAEAFLRRGDAVRAMEQLRRALNEGANPRLINEVLNEYDPAISRAIHGNNPDASRQMRFILRGFLDGGILEGRTLMLTARHFNDMGDSDLTLQALLQLSPEQFNADPEHRFWALTFMREHVHRILDRGEFEGALVVVERMRRLAGDKPDPMIPMTDMARAAAARDHGDFADAIDIILTRVRPDYPEIARNRIRAILDAAEIWANEPKRYPKAREAIARLDDFYPVEYQATRNRIVAREVSWLLLNNQPLDALDLIDDIDEESRSSELKELRLQAFHQAELQRIGENDPLELLKHGRWCMENDMAQEALYIFNKTRENPNLKELSDQLIRTARRARDTGLIEEARRLHEEGDPSAVLHRTNSIINNPGVASELQREAERLRDLAEKTLRRDSERRAFDAVVLYQRAERAYFGGTHQDSLRLLRILFENFPDTKAARQGTELLPDVLRSLEIAYLEGNTSSLPPIPRNLPVESMDRMDRLGEEVTRLLKWLDQEG